MNGDLISTECLPDFSVRGSELIRDTVFGLVFSKDVLKVKNTKIKTLIISTIERVGVLHMTICGDFAP